MKQRERVESMTRAWMFAALCGVAACGDGSGLDGDNRGLEAKPDAVGVGSQAGAGADLTVEDLECPQGGKVGKIEVAFECGRITTVSCKDLSNVVVEYEDGTRQKFDGLRGQRGVFAGSQAQAGQTIVRVWVKAGANHSGDGPGYGERFDAPAQDCSEDCVIVDGSCVPPAPPAPPPPGEDCLIADGSCVPPAPPAKPPAEEECFIVDGVCAEIPPPPAKPKPPTSEGPVGF